MVKYNLISLKRKVKNFLHLPVTRVEVLEYAKELQATCKYPGLCHLLNDALAYYEIEPSLANIFPKFKEEYAKHFGASYHGYWWERGRWDTGRLDFLNWLINEYKDDRTNIRKL